MNWSRGPGTSVILAETCQPGNSTPRFLAAQRSAVSSRREEIAVVALAAQHNTRVCGPLCDPMGSSQVVLTLSGSPTVFYWYSLSGLQLQTGLQFVQRSDCRAADLAVFRRRKAFLLCKNPCGGTAVGMGSPAQSGIAAPAQRNFQRKFALRRVGFYKFVVPPTNNHSKVRNNARPVRCPCRAAPGCQRDRGPFCFGRSPEEPLPRGSFGQLLRGGSTPRFFAQLRSVGSKKDQLAATASNHTGACRHGRQKLILPPARDRRARSK